MANSVRRVVSKGNLKFLRIFFSAAGIVRQSQFIALLFLIGNILSCTNANIQVNSNVGSMSALELTSQSPFGAEMYGGSVRLAGKCSRSAKSIQIQLDDYGWLDVAQTPQSPMSVNYEYLFFSTYDVDCSDGKFDFYSFFKQALSDYALKGIVISGSYRPDRIRIRVLDSTGKELGEAQYQSNHAVAVSVVDPAYMSPSFTTSLGTGANRKYRLKFIDVKGSRAQSTVPTSFIVLINDGSSNALRIYDSNCAATYDSTVFNRVSMPAYTDEVEFCVKFDNSATSNTVAGGYSNIAVSTSLTMQVTEQANLFPTISKTIEIKASSDYFADISYGRIKMVKGAEYPLYTNYKKYDGSMAPANLFATRFQLLGGLNNTSDVNFIQCGYSTCSNNGTNAKDFIFSTANSVGSTSVKIMSSIDQIQFDVLSTGSPTHDSGSFTIPVDKSGDTNYVKPVLLSMDTDNGSFGSAQAYFGQKYSDCKYYEVALGNSNGTPIPTAPGFVPQIDFTTSDPANAGFYSDSGCGTSILSTTFTIGSPTRGFYFKYPAAMPLSGYVEIYLTDSTYVKFNTLKVYYKDN